MKHKSSALIPIGLLFLILEINTDTNNFYLKYGLLVLAIAFFIAGFVAIAKRKQDQL